MFAARCQIRGFSLAGRPNNFGHLKRIIVVTRIEQPFDVASISDCGPDCSSPGFPVEARLSLLAALSVQDGDTEVFSLLRMQPEDSRMQGCFMPATGMMTIRWRDGAPRIAARFRAGLSADFTPTSATAQWVLSGRYLAWDGELFPHGE
jgi:hypothetical protein